MIKAILFDVDGVLIDSREANAAFYKKLLERAGYPNVSREEIDTCFHLPLLASIRKLTGSIDEAEIQRIFDLGHQDDIRQDALIQYPERLEEILQELHKTYRLGIVTSRIRVGMDAVFGQRAIEHLFDVVLTVEDYDNPKPHPEPLLLAIEKLGIDAEEAVYIGDSPTDIEAATAAGMRSILLSSGHHNDATAVIKEFAELLGAIHSLTD